MNDKVKKAKRDYYLRNKQTVIDRAKIWAKQNPEKKKTILRKYNNNPERAAKMKVYGAKYYQINKERINKRNKAYRMRPDVKEKSKPVNQQKSFRGKLRARGLTIDQYNLIVKKQNNLCAICKQPETDFDSRLKVTKQLAIDHCHKTGQVRGLLCGRCNMSLGRFEDSIELLQNAIRYLKKYSIK